MTSYLMSVYVSQSLHSQSCLSGGFIQRKKSSDDELSSNTSSSCNVEWLQLPVEGRAFFIRSFSAIESDRGKRRRWYMLCDLRSSIRKQGNSL